VLLLSEHAAYDRIKAAKVARRYPAALSMLASGRVNLTTVRLLAPHLTRTNHDELFAAASGKTKRQVQELVARRFPQPDVPASVRKLPVRPDAPPPEASPALPSPAPATVQESAGTSCAADCGVSIPTPPRPLVLPLAPDRYRITFTASEDTTRKLELVRDLLRHAVPDGDPAEIVSRALDALLDDLLKKKFALTDRPRPAGSNGESGDSAYIPAEVKRAVFIRDGGRCAFKGTHCRCGERALLEFHHVVPRACGGQATVGNIELRCRAHNGCEVDLWFGPGKRYRHCEETVDARPRRGRDDRSRSGTTGATDEGRGNESADGTTGGPRDCTMLQSRNEADHRHCRRGHGVGRDDRATGGEPRRQPPEPVAGRARGRGESRLPRDHETHERRHARQG
jgi:hypothetical protein